MNESTTRRLSAIMFTDIVGYTALMQKDERAAINARVIHREAFDSQHQKYEGDVLQYFGDGTMSVFQSSVHAVECAIAIQRQLQKETPVPIRVGLHMGDILFDGTEIYGDGVNFASRIESMGVSGAILISGALNNEIKNHNHISTISLGHFELKNIKEPVEVFAVANEGIVIPNPSQLKGKQIQKQQNKTIAVLPFVNMSSDQESEYFSDGISEEIINALAKIKSLRVTSRTSSFFYKNKNIPIPQIGAALNVSIILEGSIRLAGNKVRITAQLIDVANDFHFWSETFDRSLEDIFAVQDEISLLIADKLREHLGHFEISDRLVDPVNVPVDTYKNYLRGRYYLMKLDLLNSQKAISIFKEVIEDQPDFAHAYLDINQAYTFLGTMGLMPAQDAFILAKPFLDKGLELDENLAESQINLSWIAAWQKWDFKEAYKHIQKAHQIRPSDQIYLTMANLFAVEGKFESAMNCVNKALQLDPFSAMNVHFKGFVLYLEEKYDEAMLLFEKSLVLNPEIPFPPLYIGACHILSGRLKEGLDYYLSLNTAMEGNLTKLGGSTMAYAMMNDLEMTQKGINELEASLQTSAMGAAMNYLILIQSILGNEDRMIKLIEEGLSYRMPMMLLLYTEPILKPLRKNLRFQELMKQALGENTTFEVEKRKYKKSLIPKDLLERYISDLKEMMIKDKPFLEPNLSLRELADMVNMPANQLSQLLNEGFDKNFSEFVNAYRLETFKQKIADPSYPHLTILAMAYDCGFNSKTVFNTYFKKVMGMTPKVYWKKMVK